MIPFAGAVLQLINGPIFSIVDKLIPDPNLKAKLKAQISTASMEHASNFVDAQRDVILSETQGSLITRTWRPVLMYLIILMLMMFGLILPSLELFLGIPIDFQPKWHLLPDGVWNLLGLGVGGYVGGRSLEKIATTYAATKQPQTNTQRMVRKNNFNRTK